MHAAFSLKGVVIYLCKARKCSNTVLLLLQSGSSCWKPEKKKAALFGEVFCSHSVLSLELGSQSRVSSKVRKRENNTSVEI
ncbi:hypothetical protein L596_001483 [Steinernema carpocapsae]|uniref:Uncharacterized protein n=1 Tax=Steinernema carpocapsae TaxID=34508 RepID=A0A4U8ULP5_STECR|nr:hypothetical protein L596_001483 [Steinernema carpocapsae]